MKTFIRILSILVCILLVSCRQLIRGDKPGSDGYSTIDQIVEDGNLYDLASYFIRNPGLLEDGYDSSVYVDYTSSVDKQFGIYTVLVPVSEEFYYRNIIRYDSWNGPELRLEMLDDCDGVLEQKGVSMYVERIGVFSDGEKTYYMPIIKKEYYNHVDCYNAKISAFSIDKVSKVLRKEAIFKTKDQRLLYDIEVKWTDSGFLNGDYGIRISDDPVKEVGVQVVSAETGIPQDRELRYVWNGQNFEYKGVGKYKEI